MTRDAELASIEIVSAAQGDSGVHAAEVVAVGDLLGGLVDGVIDLLAVELGNNVEGGVGHEGTFVEIPPIKVSIGARVYFNAILHGTARAMQGRLPKRPNGSDCKSDASCFGGSNPSPATTRWSSE